MTWIVFVLFDLYTPFDHLIEGHSDHPVSPFVCLAYRMDAPCLLCLLGERDASPRTTDAGGSALHGRNCLDVYQPTDSSNSHAHTDGSRKMASDGGA